MINVLFSGTSERWPDYAPHLRAAFEAEGLDIDLREDFPPEDVDYLIVSPNGPIQDFSPFTRARAVMNLWAGVEEIVGNETLTQPLVRMVEDGLTRGMVEWVTGQVLRHHLEMDRDICRTEPKWEYHVPPLARERKVSILGLGALGRACADSLAALEFDVAGWSRTPKDIPGLHCLSGDTGMEEALRRAEILVLLLPETPQTRHVLNVLTLDLLPRGAVVINPGRGPLIDDDAMLNALDAAQVGHATLDVFVEEPLPEDHPYWSHPRVTVTPHVASATRPGTSSRAIAANIRRNEAGEPMEGLVDRKRGY